MSLYVTRALGLRVVWSGLALGAAAALEIPALLIFVAGPAALAIMGTLGSVAGGSSN